MCILCTTPYSVCLLLVLGMKQMLPAYTIIINMCSMKTELNYFVKCIASTHCGLREERANIISLLFAFVAAVWDHMLLFL